MAIDRWKAFSDAEIQALLVQLYSADGWAPWRSGDDIATGAELYEEVLEVARSRGLQVPKR